MKTPVLLLCIAATLLSGCVTLSGNYEISAVDAQGKPVATNMVLTAQGRGIYTARNALCAMYPKATVFIKSVETGKNLDSESPYRCR